MTPSTVGILWGSLLTLSASAALTVWRSDGTALQLTITSIQAIVGGLLTIVSFAYGNAPRYRSTFLLSCWSVTLFAVIFGAGMLYEQYAKFGLTLTGGAIAVLAAAIGSYPSLWCIQRVRASFSEP